MHLMAIDVQLPFQMILVPRPLVKLLVVVGIVACLEFVLNLRELFLSRIVRTEICPRKIRTYTCLWGVWGIGVDIGDSVYTAERELDNSVERWTEGDSGIVYRIVLS